MRNLSNQTDVTTYPGTRQNSGDMQIVSRTVYHPGVMYHFLTFLLTYLFIYSGTCLRPKVGQEIKSSYGCVSKKSRSERTSTRTNQPLVCGLVPGPSSCESVRWAPRPQECRERGVETGYLVYVGHSKGTQYSNLFALF